MNYEWNEPARPVDYKESTIITALKKGPLVLMPKADGARLHAVINSGGQLFLRSRANLPFPALAELEAYLNKPEWLELRAPLAGTTIEMEAIVVQPDGSESPCEVTSGTLQRLEQLPIGRLHLYHFDTYSALTAHLGKVHRLMVHRGIIGELMRLIGHYKQLPTARAFDLEGIDSHYALARSKGWEGLVAVREEAPYTNGKKVGAGWKIKPGITVEGHITGMIEAETPEGKPLGRVGSFEVDFEDGTKGRAGAGAMDHDERRHCWENQAETIGRIAEFTAMEKFAKGGYRHPNWKLWRDTLEHKGVKQ